MPGCTAGIIGGLQKWIYKERKCGIRCGDQWDRILRFTGKEGQEVILYDGNDKKDAEAMKAQLGDGKRSPRCSRSFSGRGDGKS